MTRKKSGILALLVGVLLGATSFVGLRCEVAAKTYTYSYVAENVAFGKTYDRFTGVMYNVYTLDPEPSFTFTDGAFKITATLVKEETREDLKVYIEDFGVWDECFAVFVDRYYDHNSDAWYTPLQAGKAVGEGVVFTSYFKAEDFIIDPAYACFRFSINTNTDYIQFASAVNLYSFRNTFSNGDYYEGYEYADRYIFNDPYHSPGKKSGEGGLSLYKRITKTERGFPTHLNGQITFTKYYDAESRTSYNQSQIIKTLAVGNSAHILAAKPEFAFGRSSGTTFLEADVSSAYDFRYSYTNGDYYTGTVYAPAGKYYLGYSREGRDAAGLKGYYTIQKITPGFDASKNGQVFVQNYFDAETNCIYSPLHKGQALTSGGLGTEADYIISKDNSAHLFGWDSTGAYLKEADAVCRQFSFRYEFASGDYYSGVLYAPVAKYYRGYVQKFNDELGEAGYYSIFNQTTGVSPSLSGQVFVTNYYNKENNKSYVPLNQGTAAGKTFLGSETGYIISSAQAACRFGRTLKINPVTKVFYPVIAEADDPAAPGAIAPSTNPSRIFYFNYTYANGDYYTGRVRAPKGKYTPGDSLAMTDEHGRAGTYRIYQWGAYFPAGQDGQVFVDVYYDRESNKGYTPLKKNTAVGTNYLGSESDAIIASGPSAFKFGINTATGKIWEADVYAAFSYRRAYGGGDYYVGQVYAPVDKYYLGQGLSFTDENGKKGFYTITVANLTDVATNLSRAGQVFVTSYYDAESMVSFSVINQDKALGKSYLQSETGYIKQDAVPEYKFGGAIAAEADVVARYTFIFYYGNSDIRPDWYMGYVYAPAGKYMTVTGPTVTDEHGYVGHYYISGRVISTSRALGRVEVIQYYNSESQKSYTPLKKGTAVGSNYLGSETDFIISSTLPHRFGTYAGVFYEADE